MSDTEYKAEECLNCIKKPCQKECPLDNDIPEFIKNIKERKLENAFKSLIKTTVLMRICGRICPANRQCQSKCTKKYISKPVDIGYLESTIGDYAYNNNWHIKSPKEKKYNVAIVGSGPAGLTCAAFLRRNGIGVTIYEKHDYPGGLLVHGIPDFRLDKKIVDETINEILDLGIKIKYNQELGKEIDIDYLKQKHDAIFIGIGANISSRIEVEGVNQKNVFGANEVLENKTEINYENKIVAIIGGGNVAIDMARTIIRKKPKKVIIVYRRDLKDMPADEKEVSNALKEGIEIICHTNISKIKEEKIELIKTEIFEKKIKNKEGTNYVIDCDIVIMATGSHQDKVVESIKVEKNENGKIKIDPGGRTSDKKIFSGGDVTDTNQTVASASKSGRIAAYSIIEYLKKSSKEDFILHANDYLE